MCAWPSHKEWQEFLEATAQQRILGGERNVYQPPPAKSLDLEPDEFHEVPE